MKKLNLATRIFLGLIVGVIVGIIINVFNLQYIQQNFIQPIGAIFLNLIKMIILPLIFTTLVASITNVGDMSKLGVIGKKTLVYYLCTTLIAAIIGVTLATLIQPGKNIVMSGEGFVLKETASLSKLIVDIVPSNPFKAFTEGNTMQVVLFAIFVGISMTILGDQVNSVKNFNNQCVKIIYKIVEIIMKVTPIAVVALIADVIATNGMEVLVSLLRLLVVVVLGCLVQLVVYGTSVKLFSKTSPIKFFKTILPAQLFSFTTASSAATLPISMKCAKEGLGVSDTVANFVLNLGSTINMDGGAIYQASCAVFIAQIYNVNLGISQIIIIIIAASLASIGAAAIPGTVIVMMTMVLSAVGLPLEAIALIAGIDRILDMCTTSINVTGDIAACVFVSSVEKNIEK